MDRLLARFSNSRPPCIPSALPYLSQPIPGQLEHDTDHDYHQWSFEENKIFEKALVEFDFPSPDLFEKIATRIPRKTLPQIKQHFEALLKDIQMIESGLVPVPDYDGDTDNTTTSDNISAPTIDNKFQHAKRKKGKPWSEREHEYV
ncbi:hypothetical protein F2P56_023499 [Juglans regia]|uniref:Myb-like domain-containing protein n=1 Tax=Juglans regia TaxID=51240 RepID=A0A833UE62_JUGRE|nr:hypothetical protein F2P56_023499 [Juglans regia]